MGAVKSLSLRALGTDTAVKSNVNIGGSAKTAS